MTHPSDFIINQILHLPEIALNEAQLNELTQLFSLEPHERNALLNKQPKLLRQYLIALDRIKAANFKWSEMLCLAYEAHTSKSLGSDNLLALIIELLPNDLNLITQLKHKLDTAIECIMRTDMVSGQSYVTITLYSAISIKFEYLTTTTAPNPDYDQQTINAICNEFALLPDVNLLISTCKNYIRFLEPRIRNEIKKDILADRFYFQITNKTDSEIISSLVSDMMDKSVMLNNEDYICKMNGDLSLLINKYHILKNMVSLLNIKNMPASSRLEKFAHSLLESESIFQDPGKYTFNAILDMSYRFFGQERHYRNSVWNKAEGKFIDIFSNTILRLQMQPQKENMHHP